MSYFIDVFGLKKREKLLRDELYVMLMLQRSEEGASKVDCEDAAIAVACALDSDKCPAECKEWAKDENNDEPAVVKSGDLLIKATPSTNRRAVVDGISDLDTITLKASEAITLNSVTLERYGYSDGANVIWVWLENADGKEITNHKTLSKDKVTLAIKKDYKELESTDEFTIVVELANAKAGGTIGFKVTEADASAKNLDLSDYDPYTYDLVDYDWAKVTLTQKGKADTYNYEKGESYEVQRFKAKSEAAAISVYGFTLKNEGSVDLQDGVADVTVTVNDEKVKGLKWSINNKDELQINFDEVELAIRETSIFAVNVELVDGFEDLNNDIQLSLAKSDFNAAEKKTGSRVDVDTAAGVTIALPGYSYLIRWGKIELTNTKLGTVEAAADTDDVVFWKGEITIGGEAIVLNPFSLTFVSDAASAKAITAATDAEGKYSPIKNVRIMVNGDEISATCTSTITTAWTTVAPYTAKYSTVCDFDKTIDVDKDGEIEFLANVSQYAAANKTITVAPTTYGKATILLTSAKIGKYDNANEEIQPSDFIGTIDLNNIKVQTPKAALENTKSKTVEFVQGKSDTQTIFEWKYTAKKKDVYLNSFTATANLTNAQIDAGGDSIFDELSLNIRVDGKKVATTDVKWLDTTALTATQDFTKVLVAAGESVDVKVEAHAYPTEKTTENIEFSIAFAGEDKDGNEAGSADDVAAQIKAVEKGSLSVSDGTYEESKEFRNNSVSLKKSNATIAKFDLTPSKSSTSVDLDEFAFTVTPKASATAVKVKVGTNTTPTLNCDDTTGICLVSELDETVESNGITVEISTKGNANVGEYKVVLNSVNDNTDTASTLKTYKQLMMPVQVTFGQKDMWWTTKVTAIMDQWDNEVEIEKIEFSIDGGANYKAQTITSISENSNGEVEFAWVDDWVKLIDAIKITTDEKDPIGTATPKCAAAYWDATDGCVYEILKTQYNDYFRVGDTYLKIFKA